MHRLDSKTAAGPYNPIGGTTGGDLLSLLNRQASIGGIDPNRLRMPSKMMSLGFIGGSPNKKGKWPFFYTIKL